MCYHLSISVTTIIVGEQARLHPMLIKQIHPVFDADEPDESKKYGVKRE